MPWRIISGLVALFVLTNAERWRENTDKSDLHNPVLGSLINIDSETDRNNAVDQAWPDEYVSGSGNGMDATDDEDLLTSGSGSGMDPDFTDTAEYTTKRYYPTTTSTTTTVSTTISYLTPCEQLRESSSSLLGNYVPRCTKTGEYDSMQCRGHPNTGPCWCADLGGREIPATVRFPPDTPDCDKGKNLPPCVFRLVQQSRKGLLGASRPKCTVEGHFMPMQCEGSMCYCVNTNNGVKIPNTEVFLSEGPNSSHCEGDNPMIKTTPKPVEKITLQPPVQATRKPDEKEVETKINVNVESEPDKDETEDGKPPESNDTVEPKRELNSAAHVMTQPGILAAIIGGSVVLLLCAILLVMFIVYRMRKKDEGSYALGEPKKMPNYSYQRAQDKEYYA